MPIILEDATPAIISLVGAGNNPLAQDRSRLFRYWAATSSAVKEIYDEIYLDLESQMLPQIFNRNNTAMLATHRAVLRARLKKDLSVAFTVAEEHIEESVTSAIARAQRAHLVHLQRIGARIPSNIELSRIRDNVLRGLNREYPPGSGVSFRRRIDRLRYNHTNQLSNIIGNVHSNGGARERILRDARSALIYEGPGNTPVRGGSAYRQSRRLLVAEEARAAQEVEVQTARSAGINYAYWRLSPDHKWYGGQEICEVLANTVNYNLRNEIKIGGRLLSGGMLRGLYRLDNWPQCPHPFCKCYSEPAF